MSDLQHPIQRIVLADIEIPFTRLIVIFIKWSLAAIPAAIVLTLIFMLVGTVLAAILGPGFVQVSGPGTSF